MAGKDELDGRSAAIGRALDLITAAMDLLDAHGGPADAAAHLDMALHRLRQAAAEQD